MAVARRLRGEQGQAGWCPACEQHCPAGPDLCLGALPGVSHACCGHGVSRRAYVVLGGTPNQDVTTIPHAVTLYSADALMFFALVREGWHSRYEHQDACPPRYQGVVVHG